MDREHKEHLKQSDLEYFLTHFNEVWAKYGNKLLTIVLLVVVVIMVVRIIERNAATTSETELRKLAEAQSGFDFRSAAETASSPDVKARALLRGGDSLLEKVRTAIGEDGKARSNEDIERDLQDAAAMYGDVLKIDGAHKIYRLNARLGLAAVAESRRDWDAATAEYKKVAAEAGDYSVIAYRAKARLAMMPRLMKRITFGPEKAPELPGDQPLEFPLVPSQFFPLPIHPEIDSLLDKLGADS